VPKAVSYEACKSFVLVCFELNEIATSKVFGLVVFMITKC